MKTKILSIAVIALALAACSKQENPAWDSVPVTLSYNTLTASGTKAAQNLNEGTFAAGEPIRVRIRNTGADAWTDYTFTTGNAGVLTAPDPAPYYPAKAQNIDIVAIYPATAGTSFTVAADQTADADYKASDLMFASVSNQARQAEAVSLAFSHKMAKLCINVTASRKVGGITGIRILNVKTTVSFNPATGETGEAEGTPASIAVSNNGAAVIPAQILDGELLAIETETGTALYSVAEKTFAAGQLYTLNISVNHHAVGVTTAITGWTDQGTVTVNPVGEITNAPAGAVAVDLGLSVKWANMNVGANNEYENGTYFSWGETSGFTKGGDNIKTYYGEETYAWYGVDWRHITKYCVYTKNGNWWWSRSGNNQTPMDNKTELDPGDDAARANWGGGWRMPTGDEWDELFANCDCFWTFSGGGLRVISKVPGYENATIFLPSPGFRYKNGFEFLALAGYYWSSSLYKDDPHQAFAGRFSNAPDSSGGWFFIAGKWPLPRLYGASVRAVME